MRSGPSPEAPDKLKMLWFCYLCIIERYMQLEDLLYVGNRVPGIESQI
jgi:hypothetical protein